MLWQVFVGLLLTGARGRVVVLNILYLFAMIRNDSMAFTMMSKLGSLTLMGFCKGGNFWELFVGVFVRGAKDMFVGGGKGVMWDSIFSIHLQ